MQTRLAGISFVFVALLGIAACDAGGSATDKPAASSQPTAKATATAAAATATATAAATAASTPAPASGDAMTVAKLQDAFKADEKSWMGKKVKVEGVYFSTTKASAGGKETINVSIAASKEDTKNTVGCEVSADPGSIMQYTPVVAEGTVDKGFGARLKSCTLTKK